MTETMDIYSVGECKARSDCTDVQSDLALNSPQNVCIGANFMAP